LIAYGLNPYSTGFSGGDPYRIAVVDTLIARVMNDPGDDRCILMCGYRKEMDEMFDNSSANPGFKRRFGSSILNFAGQRQSLHALSV
jgi:hypothetical protein